MTETQVHAQIASYVRKVGFGRGVVAIHIRNERAGARARLTSWKMGVLSGVPDWLIIAFERAIFLELKSEGWKERKQRSGKYNAHERRQLEVHEQLRQAGAVVEIVETLDEFLEVLRRHYVPIKKVSATTERIRRGFLNAMSEAKEEAGS